MKLPPGWTHDRKSSDWQLRVWFNKEHDLILSVIRRKCANPKSKWALAKRSQVTNNSSHHTLYASTAGKLLVEWVDARMDGRWP